MVAGSRSVELAGREQVLSHPELAPLRRFGVTGRRLTTFAIGGELRAFVEVPDIERLALLVQRCHEIGIGYRIIGAGSNLLVGDNGIDDIVIALGQEFTDTTVAPSGAVVAGGRVSLMTLSRTTAAAGLSGLEFASGIPASVGGAVRMNAGAHGGNMGRVLQRVDVLMPNGASRSLSVLELDPRYRAVNLPEDYIVVRAYLQLQPASREECEAQRKANLEYRKATQPLTVPSAGSTFRNPPDLAAGYILERAGMKGVVENSVSISELHANWIVNPERKGSASDVVNLIAKCQAQVATKENIQLEAELVVWGSQSE